MDMEPSGLGAKAEHIRLRRTVYRWLIGVMLFIIVARSIFLWWQYDSVLSTEQRRVENLANVLAAHLERTLGPFQSALNQLAVHSERIGGPTASPELWSPVLEATLSGLSGVGSLNVIDADGLVSISTNPAVTGTSRRGLFLHNRLKEDPSSRLVIGPPAPSAYYSGVFIPLGRALRDRDGQFIGVLAATFQPDRLRSFYETIDIGKHGVIQLLHPDGFLLFRQPSSGHATGQTLSDAAMAGMLRSGSGRGFMHAALGPSGDRYLTAWRSLAHPALMVTVSVAENDALTGWHTQVFVVAASAIVIALVLILAGYWITASNRAHARTIVERDQADAAFRASQAQFQAVMDHTPVLVFVKDLEGRYTFVNRAAERWVGASSTPSVGKRTSDIMSKAGADEVDRADRDVLASKGPLQREMTVETSIGRRTMLSVKFPLLDGAGQVSAIGTIVTDITDRKHAEAQLAQAQRMEAIGQLTGGVAHDFNNMLTAILLNADVLAGQIQNESLRQLAEAMRHAAEHGADLTKRLLAFGRRQTLIPQPTDINELIGEMEPLMQRTLGEHIEINMVRGTDLWPATVDRGQLENAILNLAVNARDAMPGGGQLTIETANAELDQDYADSNPDVRAGSYVMVAVGDTGAGMPPDVLTRAFEPFFTTKDVGKGTGLGLSMVYGFVKQSEGHVRIYSEIGVGTVVRLYLPRSKEVATAAAPPSAATPSALPSGTETILLVEDDSLVRGYAATQLGTLGYNVVVAENAQRAIALVESGCTPDLLFTDMIMPGGMNGRELADELRRRLPRLKVLFTSGYSHGVMSAEPDGHHAGQLLGKPYRRRELATKVREVLDAPAAAA